MFEARASPGGVIRGDEILEEARATRGDERPKSQQRRPPSPSWILLDEKSNDLSPKDFAFLESLFLFINYLTAVHTFDSECIFNISYHDDVQRYAKVV